MELQGRMLITGDTHGDKAALSGIARIIQNGDMLLVAGDFGYVFWDDADERSYLNDVDLFLERKEAYLIFVDGNHENHWALNDYPVEEWQGARVHRIRKRIIHVLRGEILELKSKKIFCFGGAFSIDRIRRRLNESYWEEELPTDEDYANGNRNMEKCGYQVDFVVTHTCPVNLVPALGGYHAAPEEQQLQNYLQWISESTQEYRTMFYFGHWHQDAELGKKHRVLYLDIVDMETDEKVQ